jgi:hypothetical protein
VIQAICTGIVAFAPNEAIAAVAMVPRRAPIPVANSATVWRSWRPDWVRGMAIYQMSIMGGTAFGAFVWGKLADLTSVPVSMACCAVSLLVALALTRHRVLEGKAEEDHTPTHPYPEPVPARPMELDDGPVMIPLDYLIDPKRGAEFESIMAESRSARLRQGAVSWGLFEDVQVPGRYRVFRLRHVGAATCGASTASPRWMSACRRRHAFHLGEEPPLSRFIASTLLALTR